MSRYRINKTDQEALYNIFRACRLCGTTNGYKMPILQNIVQLDDNLMALHKKIQECVQIEVHQDDKMPPLICEQCIEKIEEYYIFRNLCQETDERTRSRLGLPPQNKKTEESILGLAEQVIKTDIDDLPLSKSILKKTSSNKDKKTLKTPAAVKEEEPKQQPRETRQHAPQNAKTGTKQETRGKGDCSPPPPKRVTRNSAPVDSVVEAKETKITKSKVDDKTPVQKQEDQGRTNLKRLLEKESIPPPVSAKRIHFSKEDTETVTPVTKTPSLKPSKLTCELCGFRSKTVVGLKSHFLYKHPTHSQENNVPRETPPSRPKPIPTPIPTSTPKSKVKPSPSQSKTTPIQTKPSQNQTKPSQNQSKPVPSHTKSKPKPPILKSTPVDTINCNICDMHVKGIKGLAAHMKAHSPYFTPEKMCCNACGEWFLTVTEALAHHRAHNVYTCQHCDSKFTTYKEYTEHFAQVPCSQYYEVPDVSCTECGGSFATRNLLSSHSCVGADGRPGGKCVKCGRFYSLLKNLKRHEETCRVAKRSEKPRMLPEWLEIIKPEMQIRMARCDPLLRRTAKPSKRYDVSRVKKPFGLDHRCEYPYLKRSPFSSTSFPCDGMVTLSDQLNYQIESFVHWDSEYSSDSDVEYTVTTDEFGREVKVKSVEKLSKICLKTVLSGKVIGKCRRKIRRKRVDTEDMFDNFISSVHNSNDFSTKIDKVIASLSDDDDDNEPIVHKSAMEIDMSKFFGFTEDKNDDYVYKAEFYNRVEIVNNDSGMINDAAEEGDDRANLTVLVDESGDVQDKAIGVNNVDLSSQEVNDEESQSNSNDGKEMDTERKDFDENNKGRRHETPKRVVDTGKCGESQVNDDINRDGRGNSMLENVDDRQDSNSDTVYDKNVEIKIDENVSVSDENMAQDTCKNNTAKTEDEGNSTECGEGNYNKHVVKENLVDNEQIITDKNTGHELKETSVDKNKTALELVEHKDKETSKVDKTDMNMQTDVPTNTVKRQEGLTQKEDGKVFLEESSIKSDIITKDTKEYLESSQRNIERNASEKSENSKCVDTDSGKNTDSLNKEQDENILNSELKNEYHVQDKHIDIKESLTDKNKVIKPAVLEETERDANEEYSRRENQEVMNETQSDVIDNIARNAIEDDSNTENADDKLSSDSEVSNVKKDMESIGMKNSEATKETLHNASNLIENTQANSIEDNANTEKESQKFSTDSEKDFTKNLQEHVDEHNEKSDISKPDVEIQRDTNEGISNKEIDSKKYSSNLAEEELYDKTLMDALDEQIGEDIDSKEQEVDKESPNSSFDKIKPEDILPPKPDKTDNDLENISDGEMDFD